MNDAIEVSGKVWFFQGGGIEIEARIRRGDNYTTQRVKYWEKDDKEGKWIDPSNKQLFLAKLNAFAMTFVNLGFDVTIRADVEVSDLRD